jgi:hypothetical protein
LGGSVIEAPGGIIIWKGRITRDRLRNHPTDVWLFGDNVQRHGLGGMAAEMRGEPNAVGVATKWKPTMNRDAFFSDLGYDDIIDIMRIDLERASNLVALLGGRIIVPAGIGQGLAALPSRAPLVWNWLKDELMIP